MNRRYNLTQGFDGYDDDLWSESQPKLFLIRSRPGPRTAARAVGWLERWSAERPRRPFFLWMHLFDAHQPYTAPVADRLRSPSVYDAEIGVLDRAVGLVVDELRRQGRLDDTLVVVTADHGESLGEHGEKTHALKAMGNLGLLAALREDDAEAERWYRRAMAADPAFPLAYRRLADLYYERGDFAKARGYYRQALAERPGDFAAIVQAGNCARRTGDPRGAAELFARAARNRPGSWVPVYNLACLKAAEGDPAGALALLATMHGLRRTALLENDRDLAAVRRLPGYPAVLGRL